MLMPMMGMSSGMLHILKSPDDATKPHQKKGTRK